MEKEGLLNSLEKQHPIELQEKEFSLLGFKEVFTTIVEQEFLSTTEEEEKAVLEESLYRFYSRDGFSERVGGYLGALKEGDVEKRKSILVNVAEEFETAEMYDEAARKYFLAEKYEKALELLLKGGLEGWGQGLEFLWARDCLVALGSSEEQANADMADELKKLIETKKADPDWEPIYTTDNYYYLGKCLHDMGEYEEAAQAFMNAEIYYSEKLRTGSNYFESVGDYDRAIELQKEYLEQEDFYCQDEYIRLAELYRLVGNKKEEANALWMAREYLQVADIAFEITEKKDMYLKAGKKYGEIRTEKQKYFSKFVWKYFESETLELYSQLYSQHLKKDISPRLHDEIMKDMDDGKYPVKRSVTIITIRNPEDIATPKEILNKFNELFFFLYSAFSLPKPKEEELVLTKNPNENKKRADSLLQDFLKEKKNAKKSQIRQVFAKNTLVHSLGYAVLGGVHAYKIREVLKEVFKGIPSEVPDIENSEEKIKEFWEKAVAEEKRYLGFDPMEMSAHSYEKGGYYTEAKKKYLKLKRFEDVKRMDDFLENVRKQKKTKK